ncbi:uncharacterized protein LOC128682105 [Plodia interpunctella]|uniref:uncharacterized protein LOC128682105 n=1 Tax=Plodia interpunctella TaxID=58824 RepID=UPI0023676E86|nr:uncharacterized protein LOC128682105 [Plodia interpunctella]
MIQCIILLVLSLEICNGYVLLQVTKNEKNQSDVKAYVHKVLSADKGTRVRLEPDADPDAGMANTDDKVRRFEVKQRAEEEEEKNLNLRRQQTVMWMNQAFDALKKMANEPEFRTSETMSFIDKALDLLKSYVNGPEFRSSKTMKYIEKMIDIVKDVANGSPEYRSAGKRSPNMKTEIVHFKGGQPSLVFELKPNFFIDLVKKVLSAQLVEKYMDDMGIPNPDRHAQQNVQINPKRYYKKMHKYPSKYTNPGLRRLITDEEV